MNPEVVVQSCGYVCTILNVLKVIIFHKIKHYKIIESALKYLRNLVFYYKMTMGQVYNMTNSLI